MNQWSYTTGVGSDIKPEVEGSCQIEERGYRQTSCGWDVNPTRNKVPRLRDFNRPRQTLVSPKRGILREAIVEEATKCSEETDRAAGPL